MESMMKTLRPVSGPAPSASATTPRIAAMLLPRTLRLRLPLAWPLLEFAGILSVDVELARDCELQVCGKN
jgi:hypothetical protein